jgi:hypothetical protein
MILLEVANLAAYRDIAYTRSDRGHDGGATGLCVPFPSRQLIPETTLALLCRSRKCWGVVTGLLVAMVANSKKTADRRAQMAGMLRNECGNTICAPGQMRAGKYWVIILGAMTGVQTI